MNRKLLLLILATLIGAWLGGFHEWAHPHTAHAAPSCTANPQFTATNVTNDSGLGSWMVSLDTATFSCTPRWRVVFVAQCRTGHTTYQQCITAPLCQVAGQCEPAQGWGAGTSHTYTIGQGPGTFTGYWDPGDGFTQLGTVCDYIWRVREAFYNTTDGSFITAKFSPEGWCL